jgi:hypothetical protein
MLRSSTAVQRRQPGPAVRHHRHANPCRSKLVQDAANIRKGLDWHGPERPGDWTQVVRTFRDGHTEPWWAADASLGGWGPDPRDPAALPAGVLRVQLLLARHPRRGRSSTTRARTRTTTGTTGPGPVPTGRPHGRAGGPPVLTQRGGPCRSMADRAAPGARLAEPLARAATLVAGLVDQPTTPTAAGHA